MNATISAAYERAGQQSLEDFFPSTLRRVAMGREATKEKLLETAYRRGFCGSFGPTDDNPSWARKIANYERDGLRANAQCSTKAEDYIRSEDQGIGKGKRACHWAGYKKRTPKAMAGSQDYGNCVWWALRNIMGCTWCADIDLRNEPQKWVERIGTAVGYGSRGHRGQGTYGGTAVRCAHEVGIQLEQAYLEGEFDFSEEDTDEWYGNYWGGRGGPPKRLKEAVKDSRLESFAWVEDIEAVRDLLFKGHFGMHGSNYTAYTNGKLVSPLRRIGGHEQALVGYDDTDEFRDWYYQIARVRLTEAVYIHDQSWGDWNRFSDRLWPAHLWGERPEGVWVITEKSLLRIMRQWRDLIFVFNVIGWPDVDQELCPTCGQELPNQDLKSAA